MDIALHEKKILPKILSVYAYIDRDTHIDRYRYRYRLGYRDLGFFNTARKYLFTLDQQRSY